MFFYPKKYFENITKITTEFLNQNDIKGLILDIDNTLIDFDKNILNGAKEWCEEKKKSGIKMCILSNTNKVYKVKKVADELDLPYLYFAKKPLKKGFNKAKELLGLEAKNIASIGDQIFTDVIGANRSGMFSILTKPIDKRDILATRIKRPLENLVIKRYLKKYENK